MQVDCIDCCKEWVRKEGGWKEGGTGGACSRQAVSDELGAVDVTEEMAIGHCPPKIVRA